MPWHAVKQHPNLFLLCVSNFSCTIDAFTHSMLASEMGSKPYLILEIDAHTADAGVQTRWRPSSISSTTIARRANRRHAPLRPVPAGTGRSRHPIKRRAVPLTDPRVKIYFPELLPLPRQGPGAGRPAGSGLHPGQVIPLDRTQLDRGLQHTSGRECLPLPICIGQLLQIHEQRQPGEIAGFYMLQGGAPCVSRRLHGLLRAVHHRTAAGRSLPASVPSRKTSTSASIKSSWRSICRRRSSSRTSGGDRACAPCRRVPGRSGSTAGRVGALRRRQLSHSTSSMPSCRHSSSAWRQLPRTKDPLTCPRVVVTGDFFTRFSLVFHGRRARPLCRTRDHPQAGRSERACFSTSPIIPWRKRPVPGA